MSAITVACDDANASFNFHVEDRSDHSSTWGNAIFAVPASARTRFDSIAAPVPHVGDSMFGR